MVVFSAGYKEIGPDGKALEDALIQIAQKYNLNILGPNCLGFVNNLCPVNVTLANRCIRKETYVLFPNRALWLPPFDYCNATGLGFREFITLGNKAVVNENDVLAHFLDQDKKMPDDGKQYPIGMYLESISDGKELLEITRQLSLKNPVFIIKPGKTQAAAKAMQSHTGAIAGADNVLQEALLETGVTRCETLEDYFDLSRAMSWEKAPMGPKVAIVSNAGGPAVISADAVAMEGLELAEFDDETKQKLHEVLPRYASVLDPVDVLGDALADRIPKPRDHFANQ